MIAERNNEHLLRLTEELCKLPKETEWVEFKQNKAEPEEIGEYISALANSAAIADKPVGYMLWGIENDSHKILGTTFTPDTMRKGNEELENWLLRLLEPKISFRFFSFEVDGHWVVLLEIERAFLHPVRFYGSEFIRIGSYKKKLKDFPQKEKLLWQKFDQTPFEALIVFWRSMPNLSRTVVFVM